MVRMRCIIFRSIIIFLTFCATAFAQTETIESFTIGTEGQWWLKEYQACNSSFHSAALNLREMRSNALSYKSHDMSRDFYSNKNPEITPETKIQSDDNIVRITGDQNFALGGQGPESKGESTRYDLFKNEDKGLGTKLLRASVITHTFQAINLVLMIPFPDHFNNSISSWDEAKSNFIRAWTTPQVWDKDHWTTNYIGHPYIGSFYYNMMRSQGASPLASLLFSTAQSLIWEYVIEAFAEQPSIQDLIFTPTLGSGIGELTHRAMIRLNRNGFSTFEKILVTFINPAYVINNGYKKHHSPDRSHF